jgi:hypothetical protein
MSALRKKAPSPTRLRREPSPGRGEGEQRSLNGNALPPQGVALSPCGRGRAPRSGDRVRGLVADLSPSGEGAVTGFGRGS